MKDALQKAVKVRNSKTRTTSPATNDVIVVPLPAASWAIISQAVRRKMRSFTNAGDFENAKRAYAILSEIERAVTEHVTAAKTRRA